MINIRDIQKVFLVGIGGIGMSALARYFRERGCDVSGYDRTSSLLTIQLEEEGMNVQYEEEINDFIKQADLVIYTPAISKNNIIYNYAIQTKKIVCKRSEILQMILEDMECIAVAGTHGKTTTSSMIAHILRSSGFGCHAFLGGISGNYNTNYWSDKRPLAVVEADEYDRSFLKLSPDKAVLTATDADHLDIYETVENLQNAFVDFTQKIKPGGLLVYNKKLKNYNLFGGTTKWSYSINEEDAFVHVGRIEATKEGYVFDAVLPDKNVLNNIQLHTGGRHNVENALAAAAVCYNVGVPPEKIKEALTTFIGVKRRFEYIIRQKNRIYIDDYAHHPEELRMLLLSIKEQYPEDKCTIVFQPHLYSRTRDYAGDFAKVLLLADAVILLPVYPAREEPIEGVDSQLIVDLMNSDKVELFSKEMLCERLKKENNKIVITAGAGDIGYLTEKIKNCLEIN